MEFKIKINGLPIEVGSLEIDFPCPNCEASNRISLAQVEREETIQCIKCKSNIKLQDSNGTVKKGIKDVQTAFDKFEKKIRSLKHISLK